MRVSRQSCLVLTLLVTVLPAMARAQSVMQITTTSLRPGIWVLSGFANGNILVPASQSGQITEITSGGQAECSGVLTMTANIAGLRRPSRARNSRMPFSEAKKA